MPTWHVYVGGRNNAFWLRGLAEHSVPLPPVPLVAHLPPVQLGSIAINLGTVRLRGLNAAGAYVHAARGLAHDACLCAPLCLIWCCRLMVHACRM